MKQNLLINPLLFVAMLLGVISGCEKDDVPVLSTIIVSDITQTTAICGGNITSDGGTTVIARGVCWSTTVGPTINDKKSEDGTGAGYFTSRISGLEANTTYYVRAYAKNSEGTGYGSEMTFISQENVPVLSTIEVTEINQTTATSGGNIVDNNKITVIARGVCWSTTAEPTINDNKTEDGEGTGSYSSNITDLEPNTTYYVRAYATNNAITVYGSAKTFITQDNKSISTSSITDSRDGTVYQTVIIGNQEWMSENLKYLPDIVHNRDEFRTHGINSQPAYGVYGYNGNEVTTAKTLANYSTYGVLYNWYAVNTVDICPTGWHVPSDDEWTELENYLANNGHNYDGTLGGGRTKIAKSLASTSGWNIRTATNGWVGTTAYSAYRNKSGFTALPGGYRDIDGTFREVGGQGYWWSSSISHTSIAYHRGMLSSFSYVLRGYYRNETGFSVRCVRD